MLVDYFSHESVEARLLSGNIALQEVYPVLLETPSRLELEVT